jgi:hypothetical protein
MVDKMPMRDRVKIPRIPFDVISVIARVAMVTYHALLALPRFGRASLSPKHQLLYQTHFTVYTIDSDGAQRWNLNRRSGQEGKLTRHRIDGPAVIYPDGQREWYFNDKWHCTNGPAVNYPNGIEIWIINGQWHRIDGPAVIYPDGQREWYFNDKWHRIDGPAVIYPDGQKEWWIHGHLHRCDGPAVIYPNGNSEYWINGKSATEEQVMGKLKR